MPSKIFINYRRGADQGLAAQLFEQLTKTFERDRIFMDIHKIPPGHDFVQVIKDQVRQCDVVLAVIGPDWVGARDGAGKRRLDNPNDFVRIEIEAGLKLGKLVIPVLVNGANIPGIGQLPDGLKPLVNRNAVNLQFRADIQDLIDALRTELEDSPASKKRGGGIFGVLGIRKKRRYSHNKRVFLIASSFNEEWQIELNYHLLQSLRRANLSCTIFVPSGNHTLGERQALQSEVLADASDYSGGISIISGWPQDRAKELNNFAARLSKPVVFVDQNPLVTPQEVLSNMSFVSVSDSSGGRLAAEAALQLGVERTIRRALVIAGFAKHNRYKYFEAELLKNIRDCEISITEDGDFSRSVSENLAYRLIVEGFQNNKPFDIVFCTADSMTLGCLDAIARIHDWNGHSIPRVIGYDGTASTRRIIEGGVSPLARIVIQDTQELARASVEQLMRMREGEEPQKIVWIEPFLFPRLKGA